MSMSSTLNKEQINKCSNMVKINVIIFISLKTYSHDSTIKDEEWLHKIKTNFAADWAFGKRLSTVYKTCVIILGQIREHSV